MVQMFQGLSRF